MTIKELKPKSPSELRVLLGSEKDKLREFRFKAASEQLKNIRDIRKSKRTIARILTLLAATQKTSASAKATADKQKAPAFAKASTSAEAMVDKSAVRQKQ